MRVIINLDSAQKLLPYLKKSVYVVIVTKNIIADTSIEFDGRNFPVLPYESLENLLNQSEFDYFLVCKNDEVDKINPAKIIYVDSILNEDFLREIVIASSVEKKIADFEMVAVGGFSALMGFNVADFPVNTLNLASKNQDMWLSYHWLKKVLSMPNNKIRYALIGLSPYSFRYNLSTSADKWDILSYYSIFKDTHNLPLDAEKLSSIFNEDFFSLYNQLKPQLINNERLLTINFSDPRGEKNDNNRQLIQQDSYGIRSAARHWGAEKYAANVQENSKIFEKCLKLCKVYDVIPIVVNFPVHSSYKIFLPKQISAEFTLTIHNAKKISPFHYIDCFDWEMNDGREFCRMNTVNSLGGRRITAKINQLIQKLSTNKMRVGFICQGGNLEKLEPVYESMSQRGGVECVILIVPPYENYDVGKPFNPNDPRYIKAQQEVFANYGDNKNTIIVKVLFEEGFLNVESLNLDYVFYKRPYEVFLPPNVRCQVVNQFSKTCYVPYAAIFAEPSVDFALNNIDFFNTLNFFFTDYKDCADKASDVYKTEIENSDQKFLFLGSPEIDDIRKYFAPKVKNNLKKVRKSILWTPRWTYQPPLGGSHFMEYKDGFTSLRRKYPNLALNLRPHPLTFPEMIKDNRMTKRDVVIYKDELKRNNIYLDGALDEYETLKSIFAKSDIMITDMSTIILLYFMTGNPIIYCPPDYDSYGNGKIIEPALYKANSWEDVEKYLAMLLSGEDPLRDERRQLIEELQKLHKGAAERITQAIIDDYNKTNWKYD